MFVDVASWKAIVGKIMVSELVSADLREQKKLAPSRAFEWSQYANVCAMVVFPLPAGPCNQKNCSPLSDSAQVRRDSNSPSRVPS